jgi:hypothetical protein
MTPSQKTLPMITVRERALRKRQKLDVFVEQKQRASPKAEGRFATGRQENWGSGEMFLMRL